MKYRKIIATLGALALLAGSTGAAVAADDGAAADGNARVNFASKQVRNWRADGNRALYIESSFNDWYRAELMGPCTGLNFANTIGFDFGTLDTFDKFSAIIVDGQRCQVKSVTRLDGEPPRKGETEEAEKPGAE